MPQFAGLLLSQHLAGRLTTQVVVVTLGSHRAKGHGCHFIRIFLWRGRVHCGLLRRDNLVCHIATDVDGVAILLALF